MRRPNPATDQTGFLAAADLFQSLHGKKPLKLGSHAIKRAHSLTWKGFTSTGSTKGLLSNPDIVETKFIQCEINKTTAPRLPGGDRCSWWCCCDSFFAFCACVTLKVPSVTEGRPRVVPNQLQPTLCLGIMSVGWEDAVQPTSAWKWDPVFVVNLQIKLILKLCLKPLNCFNKRELGLSYYRLL